MYSIKQKDYVSPISEYIEALKSYFGRNLLGILLFGSVARGNAKPYKTYESDIDLLVILKNIPKNLSERILFKIKIGRELDLNPAIQAIWMTPHDLEEHMRAKAGYILDAFDEGTILFDPEEFLERKRKNLLNELKRKGVIKTKVGWMWPCKVGETLEL